MGPKGLLDDGMGGQMGDYRPEVQQGAANPEYQQRLMDRNFPDPNANIDPTQVQKMAELLASKGFGEAAALVHKIAGYGAIGAAGVAAGSGVGLPGAAGLGATGLASFALGQGAANRAEEAGLQAEGINSERYPGIYGSQ